MDNNAIASAPRAGTLGAKGELLAPQISSLPVLPGTASFEVRAELFTLEIEVSVDLNSYPYNVLSGFLRGNICTDPGKRWIIVGGVFSDAFLGMTAVQKPLANAPVVADLITTAPGGCSQILNIFCFHFQAPDSWSGNYTFGAPTFPFQNTIFKGWQPLPT